MDGEAPRYLEPDDFWIGSLNRCERLRAAQIASKVGERLRDPAVVRDTVCAPRNLGLLGDAPWDPRTLSHGSPAVLLLFGELDRQHPEAGWDHAARAHVHDLVNTVQRRGVASCGLMGGVSGVTFAIWSVSRDNTRYQRLVASLKASILVMGEQFLDAASSLGNGTAMGAYDAVEGAAGLARCLLLWDGDPAIVRLRARALAFLASLAQPVSVGGKLVPGWYIAADRQFTSQDMADFPSGNFNCGLAHGIPGPLAALAIASLRGVTVEGQEWAMRCMSDWIVGRHFADEFGPLWPPRVALEQLDVPVLERTRPTWCYGVPGIARALYLAGRALADNTLCELSLAALKGIFRREKAPWGLDSPTVCHGRAGLLQITTRMARDTGDPELRQSVASLTADLVAAFDETAPFGYRDVEQIGDKVALVDKVGILEGAAGVALALNSAAASERSPVWDAALLIA